MLTPTRQGISAREEKTERRAWSTTAGPTARDRDVVVCSIWNEAVEGGTFARGAFLFYLHPRCALGFVEDSIQSGTGILQR